jgi:peptide deformylase
MTHPIYIYGHPVLRKVAEDIDKDHPGLSDIISDLFDTMYNSEGLGLAAPQIGKSIRVFVIDGAPVAEDEPELAGFRKTFINAHILERNGEVIPMLEGCLSIPGMREEVNRESRVRIKYFDENWEFHDDIFEGYKARIIQHEYDHLDGILFTDKVNALKKRLIKNRLNAISKGKFEASYKTVLGGKRRKG